MQRKDETLYNYCHDQYDAYVELWQRLVNIDSGTGYGEGLTQVGNIVIAFLQDLGIDYKTYQVKGGSEGFHIVATCHGVGQGKVLTLAHMDTVFAAGTARERPFRIEDEWAYGPGVSDCKGSVVQCLFALKAVKELGLNDFATITCLFNCDEETGSPDSKTLTQSLARKHDIVLCCEPGQYGDGVVLSRKGSAEMKMEVQGRPSHAGNAPQEGRNALLELVHQVGKLSRLEEADSPMSLNFTTFHSGDKTNVIPDHAVAFADIRITEEAQLARIERESARIVVEKLIPDTTVTVTIVRHNPPFPPNQGTEALVAKAQDIYGELGMSLLTSHTGGASDANWAAAAGAIVLDGVGPVKGGINHTPTERTDIRSVVPRLYLLTRLLCGAGKA